MTCQFCVESQLHIPEIGGPGIVRKVPTCQLKSRDQEAKLQICCAASEQGIDSFFHDFCSFVGNENKCPRYRET